MEKVIKFFSKTWDYTIMKHREYYIVVDNQCEEVDLYTVEELKDFMIYRLNGIISSYEPIGIFKKECEKMLKRL